MSFNKTHSTPSIAYFGEHSNKLRDRSTFSLHFVNKMQVLLPLLSNRCATDNHKTARGVKGGGMEEAERVVALNRVMKQAVSDCCAVSFVHSISHMAYIFAHLFVVHACRRGKWGI